MLLNQSGNCPQIGQAPTDSCASLVWEGGVNIVLRVVMKIIKMSRGIFVHIHKGYSELGIFAQP
jgi:hypothetical protein